MNLELNAFTISSLVAIILGLDKGVTWVIRKFNKVYRAKKNKEEFKELVESQQLCIENLIASSECLKAGMTELLKMQLKESHQEYMAKQKISSDEMTNFNQLYDVYHSLGGNGTGTKYHIDVGKLTIVD